MISPFDSEVSGGGAFIPDEGPVNRQSVPLTTVGPCAPFYLVFDPQRWTLMENRVVPFLYELRMIPGLNGVEETVNPQTGKRTIRTSHARSDVETRGHTIIRFDAIPDAHRTIHGTKDGPKSYLWNPVGRPDVTLSIYTRVFPGNNRIEADIPRYFEWLDYLEGEGIVTPPPSFILRDMLANKRKERDRVADTARTVPSLSAEAGRLAKDVEAIEKTLAAREKAEGVSEIPASGGAFSPDAEDEAPPVKKAR